MNVEDLVLAVGLSPVAAYAIWQARTAWRDPEGMTHGPADMRRVAPAIAPKSMVVVFMVVFLAGNAWASALPGATGRIAVMVNGAVAGAGLLGSGVLVLTSSRRRRPRFVVPPGLRRLDSLAGLQAHGQAAGSAGVVTAAGMAAPAPGLLPAPGTAGPVPARQEATPEGPGLFWACPVDPAALLAAARRGEGVLALARASGGGTDLLRAYRVVVDGKTVGKIKRGKRVDVAVAAGRHEVQLKVDWCSSPVVALEIQPGQVARLYCEPAAVTRAEAVGAVLQPREYIRLSRL